MALRRAGREALYLLRLREQGIGVPGLQANRQGLEDQVRGQSGSETTMFGRGTELQVRCDPIPKTPSPESNDFCVRM